MVKAFDEVRLIMLQSKVDALQKRAEPIVGKGEGPGHPFRGNQYTTGQGGESSEGATGGAKETAEVAAQSGWTLLHAPSNRNMNTAVYQRKGGKEFLHVHADGAWSHEIAGTDQFGHYSPKTAGDGDNASSLRSHLGVRGGISAGARAAAEFEGPASARRGGAKTYVHHTSGKEIVSTAHPGADWRPAK